MVGQFARDLISMRNLDEIALCNGRAVQRAQHEKAVQQAFLVTNSDGGRRNRRARKGERAGQ
jgi:hypothetical protein